MEGFSVRTQKGYCNKNVRPVYLWILLHKHFRYCVVVVGDLELAIRAIKYYVVLASSKILNLYIACIFK
jgi:hypothetical protein